MPDMPTKRGVVFWPVGTGDSTTVVVDDNIVMQVDLNDMVKADSDDTAEVAVVDKLIEGLPTGPDGRPYLGAFVLTHADLDHCRGFEDLLAQVTIGELWVSPRLWRDLLDAGVTLSASAMAVKEEAERRVETIKELIACGEQPGTGDRLLVVGYDTDHDSHAYSGLPMSCFAYPGQTVTSIDGVDCTGRFAAFLHAPFASDCAGERNATSIAMQVTLEADGGTGEILLLGDLAHETIRRIGEETTGHGNDARLNWNVLLAPHHCSKYAIYNNNDELQQDVLEILRGGAYATATVISSSHPIPQSNVAGDNPPHRKAADRYIENFNAFVCTMEHGTLSAPSPVAFEVDATGISLLEPQVVEAAAAGVVGKALVGGPTRLGRVAAAAAEYAREKAVAAPRWYAPTGPRSPGSDRIAAAVTRDRGAEAAPTQTTGFGRR